MSGTASEDGLAPVARSTNLAWPHDVDEVFGTHTVLVEIQDEWQVGERRYLSEGSMALLIKPPASSEGLATPALLKA